MKKTTLLKNLLYADRLNFIMEAHNALSAKIVEEAGFLGVWASGLTISASLGLRDNNELSWTQVLEILEFMTDYTNIPILVDGDTGHGNFNNARRFVKKLEKIGIAGVCIEDKIFPKINSFIASSQQKLTTISEFCGKIKAIKDNQLDNDFCLVARTEAFIVGHTLDESLHRCYAFVESGADAILVHSQSETSDEIVSFLQNWKSKCPVVIVPTTYSVTPTSVFRKAGVRLVIWGNQLLRGSIQSMQALATLIKQKESVTDIENLLVPVSEILRLQNFSELLEAEKKYLANS